MTKLSVDGMSSWLNLARFQVLLARSLASALLYQADAGQLTNMRVLYGNVPPRNKASDMVSELLLCSHPGSGDRLQTASHVVCACRMLRSRLILGEVCVTNQLVDLGDLGCFATARC